MKIRETHLPGILIIEPKLFGDERGYFLETYQADRYAQAGISPAFAQDNLSFSRRGTVRGLHLQHPHGQGKLVYVLEGEVFDVAVDVRTGSPAFGRWLGVFLSASNKKQLWIPPGFAHGFCVVSETALFAYKCTELYHPEEEIAIRWNDPSLGIEWPICETMLSEKDAQAPLMDQIQPSRLPVYASQTGMSS